MIARRRYAIVFAALAWLGPAGSTAFAEDPKDPLERVKLARDRTISQNNLKQICLAMIIAAESNKELPRDIAGKNGKALLSWRVAVLPYLEQNELYKQFKLDEPWDSENNKKLLEKIPKTYIAPRGKFEKGQTFYQSFAGPGAIMSGQRLKYPAAITDGTSQTFMVVEAGEAVPWTKPADVKFDLKKAVAAPGGIFGGDFNAAFADGSVRYFKKGLKEETLKKLITINGGEVIEKEELP
jgi:prepilin-type processing-associated H-X9-DG protein